MTRSIERDEQPGPQSKTASTGAARPRRANRVRTSVSFAKWAQWIVEGSAALARREERGYFLYPSDEQRS